MRLLEKMKELLGNEDGFSLVELICVIFLILFIAAIVLMVTGHMQIAKIIGIAVLVLIVAFAIFLKIISRT